MKISSRTEASQLTAPVTNHKEKLYTLPEVSNSLTSCLQAGYDDHTKEGESDLLSPSLVHRGFMLFVEFKLD